MRKHDYDSDNDNDYDYDYDSDNELICENLCESVEKL